MQQSDLVDMLLRRDVVHVVDHGLVAALTEVEVVVMVVVAARLERLLPRRCEPQPRAQGAASRPSRAVLTTMLSVHVHGCLFTFTADFGDSGGRACALRARSRGRVHGPQL